MPVSMKLHHQGFKRFCVNGQLDLVISNQPQGQTQSWVDSDNTKLLSVITSIIDSDGSFLLNYWTIIIIIIIIIICTIF